MATGLFMGIRGAFTDEAQEAASMLMRDISRVLAENGLPTYVDPITPPDVTKDTFSVVPNSTIIHPTFWRL